MKNWPHAWKQLESKQNVSYKIMEAESQVWWLDGKQVTSMHKQKVQELKKSRVY